MGRPRKNPEAAPKKELGYLYKGVMQYGDCRLWNKNNIAAYYTLVHQVPWMVGPGDAVDDVDPKQQYTFYLFEPSTNADSARELDRLRRGYWFKCETPRFCSPTGKFQSKDGALVFEGQGILYALPKAKLRDERFKSRDESREAIAGAHASLADAAKAAGYDAVEAQTRHDLRGQRLK